MLHRILPPFHPCPPLAAFDAPLSRAVLLMLAAAFQSFSFHRPLAVAAGEARLLSVGVLVPSGLPVVWRALLFSF